MYGSNHRISNHTSFLSLLICYSGLLSLWKRLASNKTPVVVAFYEVFDEGDNTDSSHESSLLTNSSAIRDRR
jgi:hypothetical protein